MTDREATREDVEAITRYGGGARIWYEGEMAKLKAKAKSEDELVRRLANVVEDLLAASVSDKSNDVVALKSSDDLVIRARSLVTEARR